ncbi:hypothetical protein ACFSMW_02640 [Virgibacillus halophilus]|uniref:Uncharacterized protein n=1 Tax=Tigheibacillus halophilus TaxID=361280 RepID=A0ABU5CBC4_9BACI|nr:hypothetical protein [Virgibacillus halophilus]
MYPVFYAYYPVYAYHPYRYKSQNIDVARPQYPPVDINVFSKSAASFQTLMKDAELFVKRVSTSSTFAREIMNAAQQGDKPKVQSLVSSTGITEKVDVQYNPDQLRISLTSKAEQPECCKLTLAFRWR